VERLDSKVEEKEPWERDIETERKKREKGGFERKRSREVGNNDREIVKGLLI